MMLLSNLAEPEWIQISCTEKLLADVICTNRTDVLHARNSNYELREINMVCPINAISKDPRCYLFLWKSINEPTDLKLHCSLHNTLSVQGINMPYFQFLFDAIQPLFPPILSPHQTDKTKIHRFTYDKYFSVYNFKESVIPSTKSHGFNLCTSRKTFVVPGENVFQCRSYVFISYLFVCDGTIDCPNWDDSDEESCHCEFTKKNREFNNNLCKELVDHKNNKTTCSSLYFSAKGTCHKYTTIKYQAETLNKAIFLCSDNSTIDITLKNDMVIDCPNSAEDEEILESFLKYEQIKTCRTPYEIPCKKGYSNCFNVSDICNYRVNSFGRIQPCSNGANLHNCEHFECNMMYKCIKSYCIPWSYVCDGKWDCSKGEDETYNQICKERLICVNMFKCKGKEHKCLHLGNTCDYIIDCPQGDDEYLCELKHVRCAAKCVCLALAIECLNVDVYSIGHLFYPYISVSVLFSHSFRLANTISTFNKAKYLKLNHNGFSQICHTFLSNSIILLDLSYNFVKNMKKHCFVALSLLKSLTLSSNYITTIEMHAFCELTGLIFLDLSNNFLTKLSDNIIKGSNYLKIFLLKNVTINFLDKSLFNNMNSIIIDTNDYRLCCVTAPHIVCTAMIPWYISCSNLLPSSMMRWSFIMMSIFIIVINGISVVINSQIIINKAYFICLAAVNVSDVLCGVYLGIIWIFDVAFEGKYILKEEYWRSGPVCFLAFGIMFYFTVTSQFALALLAISRLMVVINPLHTTFKNFRYVLGYAFSICILSFMLTVVTTLSLKVKEEFLPTSLCLPFIDPTNSVSIINILIWSIIISQCVTSLVITVSHILLIRRLSNHQEKLQRTVTGDVYNISLPLQLIIVTLSNVLCWFPANIIYVITMIIPTYPIDLVIWMIVFVVPLNSLINPIVFISNYLRSILKSQKKSLLRQ